MQNIENPLMGFKKRLETFTSDNGSVTTMRDCSNFQIVTKYANGTTYSSLNVKTQDAANIANEALTELCLADQYIYSEKRKSQNLNEALNILIKKGLITSDQIATALNEAQSQNLDTSQAEEPTKRSI